MKAHQNRNMNYDEMHEYVMFNEAAQLARGIVLSLCKHNLLFNGSYERNVSVQTCSHIILAMHCLFPLLEGSQLDPRSSRSCAASDGSWRCISPSVAILTGADFPLTPPTARGGGMNNVS